MSKDLTTGNLLNYNLIAGVLHLAQMVLVLALSNNFTLPIVARYMAGPPGTEFDDPFTLLNAPIGITVAIFLGLSAFFHFQIKWCLVDVESPDALGTQNNYVLSLKIDAGYSSLASFLSK